LRKLPMINTSTYEHALLQFFAPLRALLEDPKISEIVLNGPEKIYVEEAGRLRPAEVGLTREALLGALRVVAQYVGRDFDEEHPILEAHLPNGARLEAVMSPIAADGPCVAIRKHQQDSLTVSDLVALGAVSEAALREIADFVRGRKNILVSGGTGSGKTSLLRCFATLARSEERIVVLEDARELRLPLAHVVSLETRPADPRGRGQLTMTDLLRATLRLRPDRIVVGEVRGPEALDLIQAMSTGHGGCLSTIHASSPSGALRRLETLAASSSVPVSLSSLRSQVAHAIDMIVQTERLPSGKRGVVEVAFVEGLSDSGEYRVSSRYRRQGERLVVSGEPYRGEMGDEH
jgi:pilus assembly protein CpaF